MQVEPGVVWGAPGCMTGEGADMGELDPKIKIRAPLRCDGIGRLDCAEDTESGSRLAIRWLPLEANGDAAAKACERLPRHPTLPRILQTGAVGASAFVAMDFPEGRVLAALLEDRLDIDLVIRVASQLTDALATVHEQSVVHGELSTDSILIVPADRAYLWDMPLVIANRLTDRRGENRLMQNLPRTAGFLAPERARGSGASYEGDVYSLGVVLCAMAGAPQPAAQTTLGVVHLVASGEWTPRVPSTIPDPWRSMISRMVSADPSVRPSAREVSKAFAAPPAPAMLPTVPEMPAVRLPPELMAAAEALAKKPAPAPEVVAAPIVESTQESPGGAASADAAVVAESAPAESASESVAEVPTNITPLPEKAELVASGETVQVPALQVAEASVADAAPTGVVAPGPSVTEPPPPPRTTSQEVPEVSALDVVKLPTVEMPAVTMNDLLSASQASSHVAEVVVPPAPVMTHAPSSAVPMTESIMVSPELANAGAVTLTTDQLAELSKPPKWVFVVGGAMAMAILVLLVVAINLAAKQGAAARAAEAQERQRHELEARVPKTPTTVKQVKSDPADDDLAPVKKTPKKARVEEKGFDMPERNSVRGPTEM